MMFSALDPDPEAKITRRFIRVLGCVVTAKKRINIKN
ncbi:hypothetical protein JIP1097_80106 [Tenacibaculum maritimum]|nr:hypothetical protein JIP1097_80106 [Tenacibaculum maritimum]